MHCLIRYLRHTVLETIKEAIDDAKSIERSFNQFFVDYMVSVQDLNIELEIKKRFNRLNPTIQNVSRVDRYIQNTHEGLVSEHDKR